jgi:hypothetical protein
VLRVAKASLAALLRHYSGHAQERHPKWFTQIDGHLKRSEVEHMCQDDHSVLWVRRLSPAESVPARGKLLQRIKSTLDSLHPIYSFFRGSIPPQIHPAKAD